MKIEGYIDYRAENDFTFTPGLFKKNSIVLGFDSFETYNRFLNDASNNFFTKENFNILPDEYEKYKPLLDYLQNNSKKIATLLKRQELHVTLTNDIDINDIVLPNQPMEVDLTNLDFDFTQKVLREIPWHNKAKFLDKYNILHAVTKEELLNMYNILNQMIGDLKNSNLSPLEKVFVIYDITRSRIYKMAEEKEKVHKSRDLSNVLQEEDIVCAGYANLFSSMCCALGIHSEILTWSSTKNDESGHASSLIYINDEKYDIKGLYAFDPTWDSKRHEQDKNYINYCKYAFVPIEYEVKAKEKKNLVLELYNSEYGTLKQRCNCYYEFVSLRCPNVILKKENELITKQLNVIYKLIGMPTIELNQLSDEELLKQVKKLETFLNNAIDYEKFKQIIWEARSYETAIDSKLYNLDDESLNLLLKSSMSYLAKQQEQKVQDATVKLLRSIFGQ